MSRFGPFGPVRLLGRPEGDQGADSQTEGFATALPDQLVVEPMSDLNRPGFRDCSGYWVTASRAGSV
jgi:hypothetical protein